MKNMKKKVMVMMFAAMMTVGASAFAEVPFYGYSENGEHEAVVNTDLAPLAQADTQGYSENGDYVAAVTTDSFPAGAAHYVATISENGDYQAALA